MRRSLLWKLVGVNILVVGVAIAVAAMSLGGLADQIFSNLMQEFHIQVEGMHQAFTAALSRSLLEASLIAAGIGLVVSLFLFREVVRPLRGMMAMAERIASGDAAARAPVASRDEVGRLAESLNRMAASLETLERLRKDLVANVAHELRTPLANLRGYLEAVGDGVTTASPATITMLHEEVMRLVRLVDALHELSRLDARLPRARFEPVDLGALIRRAAGLRSGEFGARGLGLHSDVAVGGPVQADPDLVVQALSNLLDNALEYTPPGGTVTIRAIEDQGAVRLAVTNTGAEIAPDDLPYIFERFYRGDKSRARASGGAGIGLAIVKEVARVHGGHVGATSANGETTVWLSLGGSP
jgi:signal transduction histidine kinase